MVSEEIQDICHLRPRTSVRLIHTEKYWNAKKQRENGEKKEEEKAEEKEKEDGEEEEKGGRKEEKKGEGGKKATTIYWLHHS